MSSISPLWQRIIYSLLLFAAYFLTAWAGLNLSAINGFATLIWAPTGIAIAALLLWGRELWPGIALGAFLANLAMGAPLIASVGIATGNTLEAICAVYLLRYFNFPNSFTRLNDSLVFIITALSAPIVSATIGNLALVLTGTVDIGSIAPTWFVWYVGDVLGALVVAPIFIVWLHNPHVRRTRLEYLERVAALSFLAIVSFVIFWTPIAGEYFPFPYPVIVPMAWIAIRTSLRGTTLGILILASLAVGGALWGNGLLADFPALQGLFVAQFFVGTVAAVFLTFASAVEDRREAHGSLEGYVEKLEHALRRMRGEDRAKSEFIAVLAHELRNPLAPVMSSLELLHVERAHDPVITQLVETMQRNVKSMRHLLDDLLDISRISHRKYRLERTPVHVQEAIQHAVEIANDLIESRGHSLTLFLPEEDIWFEADPIRFEQMMLNLLNNAAKYTNVGGRISVTCVRTADILSLSVEDSGIGIAPESIKRIFEPFLQAVERRAGSAGLGIGLSLTKRLVELHGGTISVKSAGLGRGSTFTIEFPAPQKMTLPIRQPEPSFDALPQKAPHTKHRIVVVDDNRAAADGIAKLLRFHGHEVQVAYDGSSGLEMIKEYKPAVAVLDIGLPDIDGHELAREILAKMPHAPTLIAVTGYGQDEDKIKARQAGFSFHLTKPIGIADLMKILDKHTRSSTDLFEEAHAYAIEMS